jgi:hypothetical protein
MINNSSVGKWDRLKTKDLDNQFMNSIIEGLNCSPFEAKAILDSVHNIYGDFFDFSDALRPGQVKYIVLSTKNGPSVELAKAEKVLVTLTIDAGQEDLEVKKERGVVGLRRHRLERICHEAFIQGGLLTVEDIANRIFMNGERTIVRDIKWFRDNDIVLPLRSTIKDMGRSLSHRKMIVKKWLSGKEYTEISRETNHSIKAIDNYIKKFRQVVALATENYEINTIAFLVKISKPLCLDYLNLWHDKKIIASRLDELNNLVKKNLKK